MWAVRLRSALPPSARKEPAYYGVERLNALTDGLFAIVITLLVLELKLPETTNGEDTLRDLADNYHHFVAWVVSFVAIGRFWLVHHHIFARAARCRTTTIGLNLAMLGLLSLMPFTAALIGTYRIQEPWSTVMFACNLAGVSLILGYMAHQVMREPRMQHSDGEPADLGWHRQHHLVVLPAVALAAAALAFVEPYVAIGVLVAELLAVAASGLR